MNLLQSCGKKKENSSKKSGKLTKKTVRKERHNRYFTSLIQLGMTDVMKIFEDVNSGPQAGTRVFFVIPTAFADWAKQVLSKDPRLEPYRKNPVETDVSIL